MQLNFPFLSLAATPTRSASGSVATIRSHPTFSAIFIPSSNAAGNSGLGYSTVGKFPSGTKTADGRELIFTFVGAGTKLEELKAYKEDHKLYNVEFIPYQDSEDLIYSLNAGDVHLCVNAKDIKGVSVPSKCYGIMAVGKPILGVLEKGSECAQIIADTGCGSCCEPGDYASIENRIRWFIDNAGSERFAEMGMRGRAYLEKNLAKDISIKNYIREISEC